jgi:hypothetical protein
MPGTVKSEHLSDADRTNKCDGLEKKFVEHKIYVLTKVTS